MMDKYNLFSVSILLEVYQLERVLIGYIEFIVARQNMIIFRRPIYYTVIFSLL